MARHGKAGLGEAGRGTARHGNTPTGGRYQQLFSLGMAWRGEARLGWARHGPAWQHAYQ